MLRRTPIAAGSAVALLCGCGAPPEGSARVEIALSEQALHIQDGPVASANLHSDDEVTVNLLRLTAPIAKHRHLQSEELVYVLSGEGVLHLKDGDRVLAAGDFAVVPRNTPHGFEPTGTQPAIVLQFFVPRFQSGDRIFEAAR
jgi:mannose-6-phosphate isomerase-like protein (cupin superfamily)